MAEAICRSLITSVFYKPAQLAAADISEQRKDFFKSEFGVFICKNNLLLAEQSENIILAVKPQQVPDLLEQIKPVISQDQLIISIAAGISTNFIESKLQKSIPVIRTMPNTPLMIGAGTTALCQGKFATTEQLEFTKSIFAASGVTLIVPENLMDAVTAVSGSGPAYFFYLVEAMVQAAISLGISPDDAIKLASNTALGAAKMLQQPNTDPELLRRKVTSPGGTTEAAICVLDADQVNNSFIKAITAAAERSRGLGK